MGVGSETAPTPIYEDSLHISSINEMEQITMNYQTSTSPIGPNLLESSNGLYQLNAPVSLDELIAITACLLEDRFKRSDYLSSPDSTRDYLRCRLSARDREVFACTFLDSQHGGPAYEELFMGTIDSASVHVREVIKRTLALNAAALIFSHNYPSGLSEPRLADRHVTTQLSEAAGLRGCGSWTISWLEELSWQAWSALVEGMCAT
jgi:DNA repair protein RadC